MRRTSILILLIVSGPIAAQERSGGGYLGVGVGDLDHQLDSIAVPAPLVRIPEAPPVIATGPVSSSGRLLKFVGGYDFSEHFGLEASYETSDDMVDGAILSAGGNDFPTSVETSFDAVTIRGMGYLPLSVGSLFAGVGYFDSDTDLIVRFEDDCCRPSYGVSDSGATAIIGARWSLPRVNLRLEYETWDTADADTSLLGFGVAYRLFSPRR